jgi:hypothetical protein
VRDSSEVIGGFHKWKVSISIWVSLAKKILDVLTFASFCVRAYENAISRPNPTNIWYHRMTAVSIRFPTGAKSSGKSEKNLFAFADLLSWSSASSAN